MSGHRLQTPERLGTRLWVTALVVLPVSLGLMLLQRPVSGEETLSPGSDSSAEWAWPHDEEQLAGLSERSEVNALLHEMTRAMNGLQLPSRQPPYYLAYTLLDIEQRLVLGQLGAIVQNDHDRARSVQTEGDALDMYVLMAALGILFSLIGSYAGERIQSGPVSRARD